MADNTPETDQTEDSDVPKAENGGKLQGLFQLLRRNWTAKLLVSLIVVHIFGYVYYGKRITKTKTMDILEISLGSYRFDGDEAGEDRVARADFRLYVSLLSEVDQAGQALMKMHKYKVQQDIEELLRQAHARDFEDPALNELKRQIQETVNQTVGQRVVEHVIITNLQIEKVVGLNSDPGDPAQQPTETQWSEKVPG